MNKILHRLFNSFLFSKFQSIDGYHLNEEQNILYVYVDYRNIEFDNQKSAHEKININFHDDDYEEIFEISDYDDKDYSNIEKYTFSLVSTPKDIELINYKKYLTQELNYYLQCCSIENIILEIIVLYR